MTKKHLVSAILMAAISAPALAGGLLTNTNQNAAFLRNFAQEGTITLTSIYANPAGTAFLSNGWHLSINSQTAFQTRSIATTFAPFAMNKENGNTTHNFKGEAKAPVIPSISFTYNHDKWSVSGHVGLIGGGGKCQFNEGLGSFEAAYSALMGQMVPQVLPGMVTGALMEQGMPADKAADIGGTAQYTGYSMNSFMKGRNYYFGLQLGATYKFTDKLAGFLGIRGVYGNNNYSGNVSPTAHYNIAAINTPGSASLNEFGIALNCDQTGFGVSPIIGLDYRVNNHWNFSAKYEAPTKINLKNSSQISANDMVKAQAGGILGQFADGKKVREDLPGLLAIGAQYSLNDKVRFSGAFHEYFDKSAKKDAFNNDGTSFNKNDQIDHNTWEVLLGAEARVHKLLTVSASWQLTQYGVSDAYMNDLSFNNSANSIGVGVRIHPSKLFNIDLGYMHTFYKDRTVTAPTAAGPKTDVYSRTNNVFGVGFNFAI
ncbi:MAG: outer membrane beta-barrel protein [Bacteroidaceae bacterium]|nr:outer membrane beta-barrel protein [Bacteroidaceae bacterium]